MARVTRKLSGRVAATTRVISGLMVSIITTTPRKVTPAVTAWVRLCCKVVEMLSKSFTNRLKISPCGWVSKKLTGSRPSFSITAWRMV